MRDGMMRYAMWYRSQVSGVSLRQANDSATPERLTAFNLLYPKLEDDAHRKQWKRWKRRVEEINE